MNRNQLITYGIDFCAGGKGRRNGKAFTSPRLPSDVPGANSWVPRIARLMALAIRFDGLLREDKIRDYAELARLGRVTGARMTQIMKLLHLAPDIQEQILFLTNVKGLNERNLRSIVHRIDWDEQRPLFHKITRGSDRAGEMA
jgi:hypothetical protein